MVIQNCFIQIFMIILSIVAHIGYIYTCTALRVKSRPRATVTHLHVYIGYRYIGSKYARVLVLLLDATQSHEDHRWPKNHFPSYIYV